MSDYKDAPVSLAEVRANKQEDATLWAPREALVSMLRQIDNGLNVDLIAICYREKKDEKTYYSNFEIAGGTTLAESLGLLSRCMHKLNSAQ